MPAAWRWAGRTVKVVDGTTVSMPDTPANQQAFPQSHAQKAGVGFPLARMVVLFSLAVGTALDAALGPYRGKQTGELSLFRQLHDRLDPGDILLADRHFCSYWEWALVRERGGDVVTRLHQLRKADFRRGRRLGCRDHVVNWAKPARPEWMTAEEYACVPQTLAVREMRVQVTRPGYRTRVLIVATTLLDADAFSTRDVALLYRVRWFAELDLRAVKSTLQMGILRGKTPSMVRKEIWAHQVGLQPDTRSDGASGGRGRSAAVAVAFRGGSPNGGSLRALGVDVGAGSVATTRPGVAGGVA